MSTQFLSPSFFLIICILTSLYSIFFIRPVLAQVDAGALQQNLEKQLPLPSPLALPEPSQAAPVAPSQQKTDAVKFTVNQFLLDGVKTIPEVEVQAILKPWLGIPVTFEDIQRACDAIQNLYRAKGYTVKAIVPPQKMKDGILRILVTEAKMGKVSVETPQGPTRFSKERAAEYITYRENIDLPNPEEILANPKDFVLPNRMDKIYVVGASLMAAIRYKMTLERWNAVGIVLERMASSGHPDLAVTFARDWIRERPQGATPEKSLLRSLIPLLTEAKMI